VVLKAIEPRPAHRYASAAELREDWRRVRQGLLPRARRPGVLRRLGRWLRRWRWQAATVAVLALLLVTLGLAMKPGPPPSDGLLRHNVYLHTEPPGATAALVPIDDYGEPNPEKAIRPRGKTPLIVPAVPAGEYLVVVDLPGYG